MNKTQFQVVFMARYLQRQDSNNFLHMNIQLQINLLFPTRSTFFSTLGIIPKYEKLACWKKRLEN
jgi:hypothetical protein